MNLNEYLRERSSLINRALRKYLPKDNRRISRAMRYSVLAGGKRLRPVLVLCGAELCGGKTADFLAAACALEYIHTYSLIHDDLPAMDNDDLRRGKPTSHKKFGEATAILAGDALLTEAFRLLTLPCGRNGRSPKRVVTATALLSQAAGHAGMIEGQMSDAVEAGAWRRAGKREAGRALDHIHVNKTAALIRASLAIGAVLAGGKPRQVKALDIYGRDIGLAFQIADDILDVAGNKEVLGKRGSDRENDKLTYPALFGLATSRSRAENLVAAAKRQLDIFGPRAVPLRALADYVIERYY
ncbi:MAG: polyprenyl synthetase family protein [Endomicrobiales bacterium]